MAQQVGMFDVEDRLGCRRRATTSSGWLSWSTSKCSGPNSSGPLPRADRSKGGRPPFDHVLMFKVLILQTQNSLSDERTEFFLRDRLTWMRFLGLGLGDPVPDANTIWPSARR
jgi:hypothetical protein